MTCPRCGAEVMLGSAQCGKCGTSLFGDTPVTPTPTPTTGRGDLGSPGAPPPPLPAPPLESYAPPPPPPLPPGTHHLPPPPPPAGWTPGSTIGIGPPPPVPPGVGSYVAPAAGKIVKRASGCGCLIGLIVLAGISVGAFFIYRAVSEAVGPVRVDTGPAIAVGDQVSGDVRDNHAVDHAIVGTGELVQITADGFGDLDPFIDVFRGDTLIESDDDGGDGNSAELSIVLDQGQAYRVRVRPFIRTDGGRFNLEVVALGDAPPPIPTVPDAEQPAQPALDGGRLVRDAPLTSSLGAGQVVRFSFVGTGAETVFEVTPVGDFDPFLTVLDEAGQELGSDDDSLGNFGSRLALTIPEGQVVTLEVTEFGDDEAGSFSIRAV